MADIKHYSVNSGDFIDSEGNIKNIADLLGAEPISSRVYDTKPFAPRSGIVLNSKGQPCDIVKAIEGISSGSYIKTGEGLEKAEDGTISVDFNDVPRITDEEIDALF